MGTREHDNIVPIGGNAVLEREGQQGASEYFLVMGARLPITRKI